MNNQLLIFIKTVLPILLGLFILVLLGIILTRIIFRIILHFARKKYAKLMAYNKARKEKNQQKVNPENKEDSALFREKKGLSAPKIPLPSLVEKIPSREQEEDKAALAEVKIVDIVKPVGFWTSMILGQKLTYLVSSAQLRNKNSKMGFWVSMIEAQEKAAGREKGRSL